MSETSNVPGPLREAGDDVEFVTNVNIVDYDPRWPEMFTREAAQIKDALGERALRIEHVGSTSVPGLAAKPVIDIALTVPNSADEANYLQDLHDAGYVLYVREPEWFEHRLLKSANEDVNLHVFTCGANEVDRMVAFRDHLRNNESDRQNYEQVKRTLAQRRWRTIDDYAEAKNEIVRRIHESIARS